MFFHNDGGCQISIELKDVSLRTAMQRIEALTRFKFLAKADDVEECLSLSISASNEPVHTVLTKCFLEEIWNSNRSMGIF